MGIIVGHQKEESYRAVNYRNIYDAIVKFMGEKRNVKTLWPLITDETGIDAEYIKERNEKALKLAEKLGIFKAEA